MDSLLFDVLEPGVEEVTFEKNQGRTLLTKMYVVPKLIFKQ